MKPVIRFQKRFSCCNNSVIRVLYKNGITHKYVSALGSISACYTLLCHGHCLYRTQKSSSRLFITFCVSRRRRKMYCGHARLCVCLCVCLSVCLSVRGRTPTLLHGTGCNLEAWQRLPPSCALLGGFAIRARVALLWQHNANPSYKLASIPRYDDIVRTAGWAGSAHAAGR